MNSLNKSGFMKILSAAVIVMACMLAVTCDDNKDKNSNEQLLPLMLFGGNNVVTDGLVAYYPFNNNYRDYSGNRFNGTGVNSPVFTNDRFDSSQKAVQFAVLSDNYVEVNHQSFIKPARTEISVSFWINVTWPDTGNYFNYIILGNDFGVYYSYDTASPSDHYIKFVIIRAGSGVNNAQADIDPNSWVHVTGVYDGTDIKLYINGSLATTTNWPGTIDDPSRNLTIGQYPGHGASLDGSIDDLRIYDRVLTVPEITEIYNYHN
jgi:trimeric autotransporter adhesin